MLFFVFALFFNASADINIDTIQGAYNVKFNADELVLTADRSATIDLEFSSSKAVGVPRITTWLVYPEPAVLPTVATVPFTTVVNQKVYISLKMQDVCYAVFLRDCDADDKISRVVQVGIDADGDLSLEESGDDSRAFTLEIITQ